MSDNNFEPKIICFVCTWWVYAAADLAGVSRLQYPANVRTVRVMCSASVSPHHVLRAFQQGVDGVFVGGWHLGECHYLYGNYATKKRMTFLKQLLAFSGIEEERLRFKWISSAEAPEFAAAMNEFVSTIRELGPSPINRKQNGQEAA